ncbi:unnamed protein product, partial [Prorocentrum cordatum]
GNCTNPRCTFAHNERELRTTSGFFKTKMCSFAASGRCKHGAACRFAHSRTEILAIPEQCTSGSDEGPPGAQSRVPPAEAPPAPPSQSGQSSSNNGSSSEQNERDVFRDATSDQSTRDATSATVSTPEGSGDSMQDESSVRGVRRRRAQAAPVRHCTTMMISNVPNFLTQGAVVSLLEDLTACMRGAFDFFYCPWNPNQDRNLGYAILNFFSRSTAAEFERQWANEPLLPGTHGAKKMKIVPAALQGRAANIRHFSGFSLAHHRDPRFRPLVRAAANEALRPMALPDEIVQPVQQDHAEEDDDFLDPYQDSCQDSYLCQPARGLGHGGGGARGFPDPAALQERWDGAGFGQQGGGPRLSSRTDASRSNGRVLAREGTQMVIYITGSKTDQLNVGTVRNHYRAGTTLCSIAAMERLQAHHPQRIEGTEERLPIVRWASGTPIRRAEVQHFLAVAGLAAGLSREEIGSRSLRVGGATAMYHVTEGLSRARRFGRWQSDAFHGYLWESHEPMKGVSSEIARGTSSLTNPAKDSTPARAAAGAEGARSGSAGNQCASVSPGLTSRRTAVHAGISCLAASGQQEGQLGPMRAPAPAPAMLTCKARQTSV